MFSFMKYFSRKRAEPIVEPMPKVSRADREWAEGMRAAEDEEDRMEAIDFGEALDFHMDCGDR